MPTISPAGLASLLSTQPRTSLLDVRTPSEYEELHVPQARNIPLNSLAPRELQESGTLSPQEPVYLICRAGNRSELAAQKLTSAGFAPVVVEGGTQAWEKAGLPLTRGTPAGMSLERQVRIGAGSLVLLGLVLAYLVHPYFLGVSAFVGAGLVFAGITDWCGMGLLLARLPWNQRRAT